jgi:prenyl protein peptidase
MLLAATSPTKTILLTPILFGLAHVHHFYEFRLTHPRVPAAAALLRSAFQFAYTTLFGAYATFLFLRTGSLAAVCAVHAFCNCMGLPQVWGRVEPPASEGGMVAPVPVMAGGDVGEGEGGGERRMVGGSSGRPSILWSVAYYVLLVAGAVVWYRNLWVLSESGNALVPSEAFGRATA